MYSHVAFLYGVILLSCREVSSLCLVILTSRDEARSLRDTFILCGMVLLLCREVFSLRFAILSLRDEVWSLRDAFMW